MNNRGIKTIDAKTLRTLFPLWAKAAGFTVADDRKEDGIFAIRAAGEHDLRTIGAWVGKVMGQVSLTGGELLFNTTAAKGWVYIKIEEGGAR